MTFARKLAARLAPGRSAAPGLACVPLALLLCLSAPALAEDPPAIPAADALPPLPSPLPIPVADPPPARPAEEPREATDPGPSPVGLDIEDRGARTPGAPTEPTAVPTPRKKLDVAVFFETEGHGYDNLDFKKLDETSDQSILDSDDRNGFAFTGLALDLGYQIEPSTRFVLSASYRGLWGNDQIGDVNKFGSFLYFNGLYVEWKARTRWAPMIRVGRQRFDLGGQGGAREFVLGDVLDMVRVDLPLGNVGQLVLVPIDIVGVSAENDQVNFLAYMGQQQGPVFSFRGDRMSRRHGAEVVLTPPQVPGLDVRAYGFYTHVGGAAGSGSDISYQGELGNFADKDWVVNAGVRAAYTIGGLITPFASFDASWGIDRKALVTYDVDTNGYAWSAGATLKKDKTTKRSLGGFLEARYWDATGPAYTKEGLQYSHGYVGMKGRYVGGLLANRFLGWRPTAYVGSGGVTDTPQNTNRRAATRTISIEGQVQLPGIVGIGAGYWFFGDKGITFLDPAAVDSITPPYGYSRDEFRAEQRLGKVLGHEIDGNVTVSLGDHFVLVAQGGVLIPGAFYGVPVSRVAGTALGSTDPAMMWDVSGGVRVSF